MKRPLIIGSAVVLLIASAIAVGWFYYQANPDEWDKFIEEMGGDTTTSSAPGLSKRPSARDGELQASGAIEANEIAISALSGGKVLEVLFDEGQEVSNGDLLLVLDDRPLLAQRDALAANVDQATAALDMAHAQLDGAIAGARSEEITAAEGAVQAAAAQVDLAEAGQAAVEAGIDLGPGSTTPTEQDLDAAKAQVDVANGLLVQAQAQLDLVSSGISQHDRNILQAQVDQAKAAKAASEAALLVLDISIEEASIVSPIDGVILRRFASPGEIAAPIAPLFYIADLDELELTVYIPESDLGMVALGQRAQVSVDAYDNVFEGIVSHIASSAEFTPRNVQTQEERVHMVFAVKILLNNTDGYLRPGMPADAIFKVE